MRKLLLLIAFIGLTASGAKADEPRRSDYLAKLAACRAIAGSAERLACYDEAAGALDDAVAARRVVVIDREEVRRTNRSLFGFNVPRIPFLSGGGDDEDIEINSTIQSASALGNGRYRIAVVGNGVWNTLEPADAIRDPRAGNKVRIRRGAIGSYLMNIEGRRAVRVRRQN